MLTASTVDRLGEEPKLIINCPEGDAACAAPSEFGQGAACAAPLDPGVTEPPAVGKLPTGEERAQGLVRGLCLVLRHHNAPKTVIDSFKTQTLAYLNCEEAVFVKRAKWLTTMPMARYLKADPPKAPPVTLRFTGQFRNWARLRLRTVSKRHTHLWYSFLQAKRACHPLSEEMVHGAYEEHRIAMEVDDPIDEETHDSVMECLEPYLATVASEIVKAYVPSTLEEYLDTWDDIYNDAGTRHVASTRACYEMNREKGGQLGQLSSLAFYTRGIQPAAEPDLVSMVYQTMAVVCGVPQLNTLTEVYRYQNDEIVWRDALRGHCLDYRGRRRLKATIQVVLEPLKTRVISKGEAVPYYMSKPLQKVLHSILRREPAFRLIGRPLSAVDLIDLEQNRVELGQGQYEWFSIDYSAATDGLSASLSASILGRLLRSQRSDLYDIWMSVLAPHRCRYPFPHDDVKPVDQRNGQLMGSILSFPILCLANLGLYLHTIKADPRSLRQKMAGVLVNGDDMLYVARSSVWEQHVANGEKVGLRMSAGKAYHHELFANANSACFHYSLKRVKHEEWDGMQVLTLDGKPDPTPVVIPFLNSGLYFGQNKVMNKVSETGSEVTSRVTVIGELLKGCRGSIPRTREIYRGYLKRHAMEIREECRGRNIFFPCSLGGMGVETHPLIPVRSSVAQRQEAYRCYASNPYGWFGVGPLPGPSVEDVPTELRAPWLVPNRPAVERRYLKERLGQRELSPYLCIQPFRTCSVRRFFTKSTYVNDLEDWIGLDPEVLTLEAREQRVLDRTKVPAPRKTKPLLKRMRAEVLEAEEAEEQVSDRFVTEGELSVYHLRLDCDHHKVDLPSIVEGW